MTQEIDEIDACITELIKIYAKLDTEDDKSMRKLILEHCDNLIKAAKELRYG